MLTVKVNKQMKDNNGSPIPGRFSTKILEAESVDVHILRPGELYEVSGGRGERGFAFYITSLNKPRPEGFADDVEFWYSAYIENSNGSTTEKICL